MRRLAVTALGLGYAPLAPGTAASAAAVGVVLVLVKLLGIGTLPLAVILIVLILASSSLCVGLGGWSEKHFGRSDPKPVVLDELAGQWLTLLALPMENAWQAAAVGFVLFRALDIIKLPPARTLEKLPAGWGILLDDLAAGVYANALTQLIIRLELLDKISGVVRS